MSGGAQRVKWCPKCDTPLKTRMKAGSPYDADKAVSRTMYKMAAGTVGWYCEDWTAREVFCPKCDFSSYTVEVSVDDLLEVIKGASKGQFDEDLRREKK